MKTFLSASFILILALFSGCDLSTSTGEELLAEVEDALNRPTPTPIPEPTPVSTTPSQPAPDPQAQPAPATGPIPSGICCGFLWKPHSESTGTLVILTPPETRGRTQQIATISGAFGSESAPMRHETYNGGRPHFYFDKHGQEYGRNITVQVPLTDGSIYSVVVPDGALRWE